MIPYHLNLAEVKVQCLFSPYLGSLRPVAKNVQVAKGLLLLIRIDLNPGMDI